MRTVLRSSSEVFHYWGNQVQAHGRAGNVRFIGPIVYSYGQPIGRLFKDEGIALLSSRKFSVTTSNHQSQALRAVPPGYQVVRAPYVGDYGLPHADNRRYWEDTFLNTLDMIKKYPRRTTLLREANSIAFAYAAYRDAFKLDWPDLDAGALGERLAAEQREAAERAAQYRREVEERRKQRIAEQAKNLALWRRHEFVGNARSFDLLALRLSKDRRSIETTWGAEVPVEVAPMLWEIAKRHRSRQTSTRFRDRPQVGYYRLDAVDSDGSLHIGCHHIMWDELVLMAQQLGLAEFSDDLVVTSNQEQVRTHEEQTTAS